MPGLYGQVTEACRQAGFVPNAVQKDVWLMQTIVGLVAGGIGVALVPASLRNFHRRGVVYRAVKGLSPTVALGMVWRGDDLSPVLSSFLQVARESFQDGVPTEEGLTNKAEPPGVVMRRSHAPRTGTRDTAVGICATSR
jgi:DNA-binding transcriptional LysR family regulator